jgi:hypothetical protein
MGGNELLEAPRLAPRGARLRGELDRVRTRACGILLLVFSLGPARLAPAGLRPAREPWTL